MATDPARAGGLCFIVPPDDARCLHLMGLVDTRAKLPQTLPPPPPPRPSPGIPQGTPTSAFSLNSCSSSSVGFLLRTSMRGALGAAPGGREGLTGGRGMDGWMEGTRWDEAGQGGTGRCSPLRCLQCILTSPNQSQGTESRPIPAAMPLVTRAPAADTVPLGLRPHRARPPLLLLSGLTGEGGTRGTWGVPVPGRGVGWGRLVGDTHLWVLWVGVSAQPLPLLPGAVWGPTPPRRAPPGHGFNPFPSPGSRTSETIKGSGFCPAPPPPSPPWAPWQLLRSSLDFISQQNRPSGFACSRGA